MKKVVYYINQFFGQIGGEDMAYTKPFVKEEKIGPAVGMEPQLKDAKIAATIVCGDNYYVENMEEARAFVREQIEKYQPDLFIAGPAFNAGRYGIACGDVCKYVKQELGVEAITALYWENPAVEMYKRDIYILEAEKSAAGMKKAIPLMAGFANKLLAGEEPGSPKKEHYYAKGQRVNLFREKNGADRAVDMLVAKLKGEEYETELEISVYEKVTPAPGLTDLSKAKIALCTSGGIVPMGNPDHIPAATARFWKKYPAPGALKQGEWESVHAGYDPVYANLDPNRVAPMNTLIELKEEGTIGDLYPYLLSTTGNSTSVADATRMGQEMAEDLLKAGVQAAILTST